jgi:hypothetical protein
MKTVLATTVSLVLGFALGWAIEQHRAQREMTRIVQQMLEAGESADSEQAARAARVIQCIESGQPQEAVRLLSGPIAGYYATYGTAGTNDRRAKLLSLIEDLARTNQAVAARLAEAATNSPRRTR